MGLLGITLSSPTCFTISKIEYFIGLFDHINLLVLLYKFIFTASLDTSKSMKIYTEKIW